MVMHVTVLSSTGEGIAVLRKVNAMDRTEMASNFCELFVENNTVHFHVETTFTCCGCCHILSVLASSTNEMELLMFGVVKKRADNCTSDRLSISEHADFLKSFRVKYFGSVIVRASGEHSEIVSKGDRVNVVSVDLSFLDHFSTSNIVLDHSTVGGASIDSLIKCSPSEISVPEVGVASNFNHGLNFFLLEVRVHNSAEVVHSDERLLVGIILHCDLLVTVREGYLVSLKPRHLDLSDKLTIADSVNLEADSGRRSDEVLRVLC